MGCSSLRVCLVLPERDLFFPFFKQISVCSVCLKQSTRCTVSWLSVRSCLQELRKQVSRWSGRLQHPSHHHMRTNGSAASAAELTGIPCRVWGKGRSGKAPSRCVGGWGDCERAAAAVFKGEPRGAPADSNSTEQSDFSTTASGQRHFVFDSTWFWSGPSSVWSRKTAMSSAKFGLCTEETAPAPHPQL